MPSAGVIPKSLTQSLKRLNLHPNTYIHIYTNAKICNSWYLFNCKEIFKLQIRPSSLILLIIISQDKWIFPSYSWEVRNSMMMMMMMMIMIIIIIIIIIIYLIFRCLLNKRRLCEARVCLSDHLWLNISVSIVRRIRHRIL